MGHVIGHRHISGGKGEGKVLTKGKSPIFYCQNVSVNKCNMFPLHFTSDDEKVFLN